MLFNIKEDPHETANLRESHPERCAEARRKYEVWHAQMMETMPAGWGDPMETVLEEGGPYHARGMIKATGYDQRLRETGRSSHLAELGRRHPEEFK